jgi:Peptide N-acetyl-beta-D-glucosaminyl asparaginase amidase A
MEYVNVDVAVAGAVAFAGVALAAGAGAMIQTHCLSGPERRLHLAGGVGVEAGQGNMSRSRSSLLWAVLTAAAVLLVLLFYFFLLAEGGLHVIASFGSKPSRTTLAETGPMDVFQVYRQPPPGPPSSDCEVLLMYHVFAFSYGKPFVGSFQPPACPFNSVTMTLTVASRGRQFDRLALMFLGDVEVFRTSTAEPTPNGIEWTYTKDMTAYLALWRRPQRVIFDLGNFVDDTYTGTFNTTLTAIFFESSSPPQTADLILPISSQRSAIDAPSAFNLPFDNATVDQTFPPGLSRAIISISACGQAAEEFWYSNALSPDTDTFLNTTGPLYGSSPFREVQLLIDGYLAGVVWPFPMIFTGGIAPAFWRPIVGIDAFDLREPEIDITPWLPWLNDGKEHWFQIRVVGLDDKDENVSLSNGIGDYWVVTGKILVFLDSEKSIREHANNHDLPSIFAPDPSISAKSSIGQSANGTNETLAYTVTVSRSIVVTSETASWVQSLKYISHNKLTSEGLAQSTMQHTKANFAAINFYDPLLSFSGATSYPLSVHTTIGMFQDSSGISVGASLSRGLAIDSTGRSDESLFTLVPGASKLDTSQFGAAHYSSQPNRSYSFGSTTQDFLESSRQGISIVHLKALNGSVSAADALPYRSVRGMVGRGPGRPRGNLPSSASMQSWLPA